MVASLATPGWAAALLVALGTVWSACFYLSAVPATEIRQLIEQLHPIVGLGVPNPLIRLGSDGDDGGYLVPNDIDGITALFSPGVAASSRFETAFADRGSNVFLADASVDGPAEQNNKFHFEKKFLGPVTNGDFMTLDDWIRRSVDAAETELALQMDIEGWEGDVLTEPRSREQLARFRVIVLEVHNFGRVWNRWRFEKMRRLFRTILTTHTVVHIHPNNCCGSTERDGLSIPDALEFSLLRIDRVTDWGHRHDFPHSLDRANMAKLRPDDPDVVLPREWYAS